MLKAERSSEGEQPLLLELAPSNKSESCEFVPSLSAPQQLQGYLQPGLSLLIGLLSGAQVSLQ